MAVATFNFTTGPATLPDIGELSYNGCIFSPLFETKVSGDPVKDRANRTVKFVWYTITVDGYVTLPTNSTSINITTLEMRQRLEAQGGQLKYRGRGLDIEINVAGGLKQRDASWGPIPELLDFQPLGAGRSAKVVWQVKVAVIETATGANNAAAQLTKLLQFNYDTTITYGEDGFSGLDIKGTMEIPMTRIAQDNRTIPRTVDSLREQIENRVMIGIDLNKFRITRRDFNISRDKRTLEWHVSAEETPYMDMPVGCTVARGTYSVRPAQVGMGLAVWLCTLKATYTVRNDMPRRIAWLSFLALLRIRMAEAVHGAVPPDKEPDVTKWSKILATGPIGLAIIPFVIARDLIKKGEAPESKLNAWLIDFQVDEGLYLDSKTTTFSATWRINSSLQHILIASGIWRKTAYLNANGDKLWAISMRDVMGVESWLPNRVDPNLDVIVDFGA